MEKDRQRWQGILQFSAQQKVPPRNRGEPARKLIRNQPETMTTSELYEKRIGFADFESGTFTLSADGSAAMINGNPTNHTHAIRVVSASGFVVGQTLTNNTTGATGRITDIDAEIITLDTLTIGEWNIGNEVTNGINTTTINNNYAWIVTFPTSKRLKLWQGLTFETANPNQYSDGNSDGVIQWCSGNGVNGSGISSDDSTCINVSDGFVGNGWTGQVLLANIRAIEFDTILTQVGAGLAITGQWHGIME